MKRVHVIGTVVADIIARCRSLPKPGETVVGTGPSVGVRLGGKGLNQALHVKEGLDRLNVPSGVTLHASVGEDAFGRSAARLLLQRGVESRMRVSPLLPTGTGTIHMDENGQNAIVVSPGANAEPPVDQSDIASIRRSDVIVCQWELSAETMLEAFKSSPGKRILNAAPVPTSLTPAHEEMLSLSHVVIVNTVEAELLGLCKPGSTLSAFKTTCKSAEAIVITRGAEGAVLYERNGSVTEVLGTDDIPVDAVGAGDCFVGHFVAALLSNEVSMKAITKNANIAAGHYVSVTKNESNLNGDG